MFLWANGTNTAKIGTILFMSLKTALLDPRRFVFFYGTTPPRADAPPERVQRAATRLAERLRDLPLEGVIVYDVQDESSRTAEPRPFPYLPTTDSRVYARLLEQTVGKPTVTYKCVGQTEAADWAHWLDETDGEYGLRCVSLVGRASAHRADGAGHSHGIGLTNALEMASAHPAAFLLGGVVIPERHSAIRSESNRLIGKTDAGCSFFTSQAVYDPAATIRLAQDYADDCAALGIAPKRIVLTFTPCGRPETLRFLQWLGVRVPESVGQAILSSPTPLDASLEACAASLRAILESGVGSRVPLGINVESVSIRREEIDASIALFGKLQEIVAGK